MDPAMKNQSSLNEPVDRQGIFRRSWASHAGWRTQIPSLDERALFDTCHRAPIRIGARRLAAA